MTYRLFNCVQSQNSHRLYLCNIANHFKDLSKFVNAVPHAKSHRKNNASSRPTIPARIWIVGLLHTEVQGEWVHWSTVGHAALCKVHLSMLPFNPLLHCTFYWNVKCFFVLIVYDCLIFFNWNTHFFDMYIYCKFAGCELWTDGWSLNTLGSALL